MVFRSIAFATVLGVAAVSLSGCRDASAPEIVLAPKSASARAVLLLAQNARAVGRVKVSELRAYLSQSRIDELGEVILS